MRSTIIGVAATFVGSLAGIFYSELKDPSPYLTSQSASVSPDAVTLVLFMAASVAAFLLILWLSRPFWPWVRLKLRTPTQRFHALADDLHKIGATNEHLRKDGSARTKARLVLKDLTDLGIDYPKDRHGNPSWPEVQDFAGRMSVFADASKLDEARKLGPASPSIFPNAFQ
jgi:hypothetical protein